MLTLSVMDETQISSLYEIHMKRDFPPSELKHLSAILAMFRQKRYDVLAAYKDGCFVAYALMYRPPEERIVLLDYLAVIPEQRGRGIGSRLLMQLRKYYQDNVDVLLIECERPKTAPNEAEARKRIRFYTKSEAVLTEVRIWLFDVEYSILALPCGKVLPAIDWAEKMLGMYKQMLPEPLYEKNVRLIRG